MEKPMTIKDVASALGISPATVHKAIYNKKGVGEETRRAVLAYLAENDFKLNKAASALKRRQVRLVAALIDDSGSNRLFYPGVNAGVRAAADELSAFNVECVYRHMPLIAGEQAKALEKIYEEYGDSMDGLLLFAADEYKLNAQINRFEDAGIRVVTANSDARESRRSGNVGSDNRMAGCMAGELMTDFCRDKKGSLLILGGSRFFFNHTRNVKSFMREVAARRPETDFLECYEFDDEQRTRKQIEKHLAAFPDIMGIYSVSARNTFIACSVLSALPQGERPILIGSDVAKDLLPFFSDGTLDASIFQYPGRQGYEALWMLYRLATGESVDATDATIPVGVALASNAESLLLDPKIK